MIQKHWLIHISHEAVRPLGGVGVQIRNLIKTEAIRTKFKNNIVLAGPLFFPEEGDCRTLTNLETLKVLKRMRSELVRVYPRPRQIAKEDKDLVDRFENIERSLDVYIYYYRGTAKDGWNTNLLLVDHSSIFGQSFIRSRFLNETISRIKFETHANLYPLDVHPDQMKLGERIQQELLGHPQGNAVSEALCEEMKRPLANMPGYRDYDYILGLMIAEPLSQATIALCDPEDSLLVIANNYFGLPTLYQIDRERLQTKTMLYVTEVNPARHLTEQQVPDVNVLNDALQPDNKNIVPLDKEKGMMVIGDGRFYNIMKVAKDSMAQTFNELGEIFIDAKERYSKEITVDNPLRGRFAESASLCEDASKAINISDHSSSRIFHLASYVDIIVANGIHSRDELLWLNPKCKKPNSEIPIIAHGLIINEEKYDNPEEQKNMAKRKIIKRLNQTTGICVEIGEQSEGEFHVSLKASHYLFTKISRPIPCKAFDRDINVCSYLDKLIGKDNKKAIFLLVSNWDTNQKKNPIYEWIEMSKKSKLENISFFFINQFDWPKNPENVGYELSRKTLLWATDVSFSQSRYESFGLAQIELLQYGAICLVSSASGAYSILHDKVPQDDIESPVIIADYIRAETVNGLSASDVFDKNWDKEENEVADKISQTIYERLIKTDKKTLYNKGCELVNLFCWEKIAEKFIKVIEMEQKSS